MLSLIFKLPKRHGKICDETSGLLDIVAMLGGGSVGAPSCEADCWSRNV